MFYAIFNIKKINIEKCPFKFPGGGGGGGGCWIFFLEKQFFLISRFMLFSTLQKKKNCHLLVKWEVVSLNSRWGQWESIYPIYSSMGGDIFLAFYAIPSFLEKNNYGNTKINIFLFYRKTIVDRDSGNLYPIYMKKTNCGVSFWTCWREISGDRVALFDLIIIKLHGNIPEYI